MSELQTELYLSTKQRNKVRRALKALEEVRVEVQELSQLEINWYLEDSSNLNLMEGETHDTTFRGAANIGMIIGGFEFPHSSGGGW